MVVAFHAVGFRHGVDGHEREAGLAAAAVGEVVVQDADETERQFGPVRQGDAAAHVLLQVRFHRRVVSAGRAVKAQVVRDLSQPVGVVAGVADRVRHAAFLRFVGQGRAGRHASRQRGRDGRDGGEDAPYGTSRRLADAMLMPCHWFAPSCCSSRTFPLPCRCMRYRG